MPATTLAQRISQELLPFVKQPAQYIGGEVNQLPRPGDWQQAEIRVAVAFPDTYTIGMSHLGCQILYWLCNHTPGVCAERTYSPWADAEQIMREKNIPLFTWDTRQPVADADILAISLQYELCFTTVLNLLDLAGIPIRAADRAGRTSQPNPDRKGGVSSPVPKNDAAPQPSPDRKGGVSSSGRTTAPHEALPCGRASDGDAAFDWPLVIVGGPQADNPEPMAEFVDLVVIGDGEASLAAIIEAVREYKRAGIPRREMILLIARRFPWVYAPNLYDVSYHEDGTIAGMLPKHAGLPEHIERCKTPDFETCPFPTAPLVPWTEVVHDRIAIEIMRGCPQVCRFCHAGYTKRPLQLRSVERILEIAEQAYAATGQHEIGLLSLSTADYPHLRELADRLNDRFASRMVNLSFPSLRVDKMLQNIPWMARSVRKGGITMAVEAARDDMRKAIRKKVTDGNLLEGVREVYKAGWQRLKLYFMSGFPGERPDDIDGIVEVAQAVSRERTKLGRPPAAVTASVGWLVPKPFTPLQWMAQPRLEYFLAVRDQLRNTARFGPKIRAAALENRAESVGLPPASGGASGGAGILPAPAGAVLPPASGEATSAGAVLPPALGGAGILPALGGAGILPASGGAGILPAADGPELVDGGMGGYGSAAGMMEASIAAAPKSRIENAAVSGTGDRSARRRPVKSAVKLQTHDPRRSILEGVFARGDRRLSVVIEEAWRRGARLDGWDECYRDDIWQAAFAATGIDPGWYAHRERSFTERLPWDHIGLHMRRGFLEESYDDMYETIQVQKPSATVPLNVVSR